jgi:hypothetical protein
MTAAAQATADGQAALAAGRWAQARAAFQAALAERETPEALDGMGVALWWLGETRASVDCSERAYAGFRRAGDPVRAATTAMNLCITWSSNYGNPAAAGGWLGRAERVLADVDPNPLRAGCGCSAASWRPTPPPPGSSRNEPLPSPGPAGTAIWSCAPSSTSG